ncbi:MAG: translation initiation factor IF-2 [Rickettsiaceae bacterium]
MTNNKDTENKMPKKLTFGGARLTLGKPALSRVVGSSSSTVVVEVKRGKAISHGIDIKEDKETTSEDHSQVNRRLSILQKARDDDDKESNKISTLSKIVGMNQASPSQEDSTTNDTSSLPESAVVVDKPNAAKPNLVAKAHKPKTLEEEDDDLEKQKLEDAKALIKQKAIEPKKIKKSDIFHMLSEDSGDVPFKTRSLASIQRAKAKQRRKNNTASDNKQDKLYREVTIPEVITVAELSNRMTERVTDVMRELMRLGVMATANQSIDADTAELIVTTFGHSAKRTQESDVENILNNEEDKPEDLKARAPIVTVMGHVDHGKTSLLDALKSTDVASGESGGITQHIGAYSVTMSDNRMITFIDTPGHEAFTEMRTRGAKVTDIVILVVAADDGIKAQTVEAISHAKAAGVPIIVAINKIDKPDANIEKVKNELLQYELVSEDLGGDIVIVPVSAKEKTNLDKLEEAILLIAEIEDLKANPNVSASGVVIESRVHKGEGVIVSILVQRGTLKNGDLIVAGSSYGRVKKMNNDKGKSVASVAPSYVVEIFGLNDAPSAGDLFNVVMTEKQARDITEYRTRKSKENRVTASKTSLEDLFQKASGDGKVKELPIIIKGDVHGSIEAINGSLSKIISDEVKLKILHQAVGGITESDVTLSKATGALILGFNVRSNAAAFMDAQKNKIDIRYYSIIYNLIDDIKSIMSGMLSPIIREIYIGSVEIREIFNVSKVGKIAGSYVTKGIIKRGAGVRLVRDDIVIHEGKLKTLKRFKEDVKDVREGYECGIAFENYDDIKIGDLVEVFEIVEEQKQL